MHFSACFQLSDSLPFPLIFWPKEKWIACSFLLLYQVCTKLKVPFNQSQSSWEDEMDWRYIIQRELELIFQGTESDPGSPGSVNNKNFR